ncbi:MAG: hypothetical protein NVS1B7_2180 [Candidatus Saccharimonadales bacterium]
MDAVEEVKSRVNIEDVISEYVQLKRAGRNFKGLSPFGNEKTPSFIVSPEKQIWHDFSTGKGGNMFSFVMEMEGLDFKGALELLARKAGIDLAQFQSNNHSGNSKLKERLYIALELAAHFYQVQFSKHDTALEYVFKKRQFKKQIVLDFQVGYSPNTGTALVEFLKAKGFSEKELIQAGLSSQRYRGARDMFRGRLMIPLMDQQGRVIGFTARLLEDIQEAPKYINTPQTILYDKGRHVYGLHLAKESIRKEKYVVVAEGNLDVIASHQAGVRQVVATAGTALTEMHLQVLHRFVGDVRLCFDQDKAGQSATERAIPLASKVGVDLSVVTIPAGKDPDELIRQDPKIWQLTINNHRPAIDWLIERYQQQLDLQTAAGKRQFTDVMLQVVRQLPDSVVQEHYLKKIADLLAVSKEALASKLSGFSSSNAVRLKRSIPEKPKLDSVKIDHTKAQNKFLAIMLMQPALRSYLKPIIYDMIDAEEAKMLLRFLLDNPKFTGNPKTAEPLREINDYAKILSLQFEELYQNLELLELRNEAAHLQAKLIETYVKTEKSRLAQALHDADDTTTASLLTQVKALDVLLRHRN